ncbi:MAG: NUDIX hydrolase [Desulfovibrionaceae bacterium]|jgi:8-oxo-dGTP diphosphatase|nr:NUDIX hydrolase [Desulfovibrionaceae bacterium]
MALIKPCPHCGGPVVHYTNPVPTVDVVIYDASRGVVLVRRRNEPHGWALPGGFVDYGETLERAAVREAREETGLDVELVALLGVYSDPARDARLHTVSTVFTARAADLSTLAGGDDAAEARFFAVGRRPEPLCFDHGRILDEFTRFLSGEPLCATWGARPEAHCTDRPDRPPSPGDRSREK